MVLSLVERLLGSASMEQSTMQLHKGIQPGAFCSSCPLSCLCGVNSCKQWRGASMLDIVNTVSCDCAPLHHAPHDTIEFEKCTLLDKVA